MLSESEFATLLSPSAGVDEGDITVNSEFSHNHEAAASCHNVVNSREPSFNLRLLISNANNPVNLLQNPINYLANLNEVEEQLSIGIMTYPLAVFDQLLDNSERSLKRILDRVPTVSVSTDKTLVVNLFFDLKVRIALYSTFNTRLAHQKRVTGIISQAVELD